MSSSRLTFGSKLLRQTKGTFLLEFAVLASVLFLVLAAILDLAHAWFLRQTIINASREGARYAVVFRVDPTSNLRLPPNAFTPSVQTYVNAYLSNILPTGQYNVPVPTGAGYTSGVSGQEITVAVSAIKNWFLLHGMVAVFGGSLPNPMQMTASSTMRCE